MEFITFSWTAFENMYIHTLWLCQRFHIENNCSFGCEKSDHLTTLYFGVSCSVMQ